MCMHVKQYNCSMQYIFRGLYGILSDCDWAPYVTLTTYDAGLCLSSKTKGSVELLANEIGVKVGYLLLFERHLPTRNSNNGSHLSILSVSIDDRLRQYTPKKRGQPRHILELSTDALRGD